MEKIQRKERKSLTQEGKSVHRNLYDVYLLVSFVCSNTHSGKPLYALLLFLFSNTMIRLCSLAQCPAYTPNSPSPASILAYVNNLWTSGCLFLVKIERLFSNTHQLNKNQYFWNLLRGSLATLMQITKIFFLFYSFKFAPVIVRATDRFKLNMPREICCSVTIL